MIRSRSIVFIKAATAATLILCFSVRGHSHTWIPFLSLYEQSTAYFVNTRGKAVIIFL